MATYAPITPTLRRLPRVARTVARNGQDAPDSLAARRAALEAAIARSIAALDAMDAASADMEPDADGEAEPAEATAQPVTLAPDWTPARVIRFRARPAVQL